MIRPPALERGDKVAIVSPSGIVLPERVEGAVAAFREWGFQPVTGQHVLESHCTYHTIRFGGTRQQRLADLQWALAEDSIKAVLCSRGGYGVVHLLELLDHDAIKRHPKWLIGFSDISGLHALFHKLGIMSIHASMAKHFTEHGTQGEISRAVLNILTGGRWPEYHEQGHAFNREGTATATITGGNLTVLAGLMGTPYNLMKPGQLLFIEDIAEEPYRVERLLYQLRLAGILPQLAGLIVGKFNRYHADGRFIETSDEDRHQDMNTMIRDMVAPYGYPVAFNFPTGHIDRNLPLIEGATATLTVTATHTHLNFST